MPVVPCHPVFQDLGRAAPTDDQGVPCRMSLSNPVPDLHSLSLTVTTPGRNCSFTVTALDAGGDRTQCTRTGGEGTGGTGGPEPGPVDGGGTKRGGDVFTCVLDNLEPGAAHQLQVQSGSDQEAANLTLHTRKCYPGTGPPTACGHTQFGPSWVLSVKFRGHSAVFLVAGSTDTCTQTRV